MRELISPEGIIPFVNTKDSAQKLISAWLKRQNFSSSAVRVDPPQGLYLPVWNFTISGVIPYQYWEGGDDDKPKSGSKLFSFRDIVVPASNQIPEIFSDEVENYHLEQLELYDSAYLADWPAETYRISLSDASLKARWKTLERARSAINKEISKPVNELNINSMGLLIETFKLILVPLWVSRYHFQRNSYLILVNGQTGRVRVEKPARGDSGVLGWLLGDE